MHVLSLLPLHTHACFIPQRPAQIAYVLGGRLLDSIPTKPVYFIRDANDSLTGGKRKGGRQMRGRDKNTKQGEKDRDKGVTEMRGKEKGRDLSE